MNRNKEQKTYSCKLCKENFTKDFDLKIHILTIHEKQSQYTCIICKRGFYCQQGLSNHTRRHVMKKPFTCKICNETFAFKSNLSIHHRNVHDKNKKYLCEYCKKWYTFKSSFLSHQRINHQGMHSFQCEICGEILIRREDLASHKSQVHDTHACKFCKQEFRLLVNIEKPPDILRTKRKPYECEICQLDLNFHENLVLHMASVHQISIDSCKKCLLETKSLDTLRQEAAKFWTNIENSEQFWSIHKPQEIFSCEICDLNFVSKVNVTKHLLTVHRSQSPITSKISKSNSQQTDCGDYIPNICEYCKQSFKTENELVSHKLICFSKNFKNSSCSPITELTCKMCRKIINPKQSLTCKLKVQGSLTISCLACIISLTGKSSMKEYFQKQLHNV